MGLRLGGEMKVGGEVRVGDSRGSGGGAYYKEKRKVHDYLLEELRREFATIRPLYEDLADFFLPAQALFNLEDTNNYDRRNDNILDDTGLEAVEILRAGMLSGMTSPVRPWFKLTTPDPDLAEFPRVKEWLHLLAARMTAFFAQSNLYEGLSVNYAVASVFGTPAMMVEEDFNNLIRTYPFPVGTYYVANNSRMQVDTFAREFRLTVRQVVQRYGRRDQASGRPDWSNISKYVREQYEKGNYNTWVDICQIIQPNEEYDPKRLQSKYKRYSSCTYELGRGKGDNAYGSREETAYLKEAGFDTFPVICPRWETSGESPYALSCPGMRSLGNNKQLQHGEMKSLSAIDKMVDPPMQIPVSLKGNPISVLPGGTSYYDDKLGNGGKIQSLYDLNLNLSHLEAKQDKVRERIERAFKKKLFMQFIDDERSGRTATEMTLRHEEQLAQLGPVTFRLNTDQNDRLIEIGFARMLAQGWVPEPPEEVQGMPLKVEYISPIALAQKSIGIGTTERFLAFVGNAVKVFPNIGNGVNEMKLLENYGEQMGLAPGIVRSGEEIAEVMGAIERAQSQAMLPDALNKISGAAKNLSQADMEGDNALTQTIEGMQQQ